VRLTAEQTNRVCIITQYNTARLFSKFIVHKRVCAITQQSTARLLSKFNSRRKSVHYHANESCYNKKRHSEYNVEEIEYKFENLHGPIDSIFISKNHADRELRTRMLLDEREDAGKRRAPIDPSELAVCNKK
jgi:hypothetical protein